MSIKLLDAVTAVGVSPSIKSHGATNYTVATVLKSLAATKISAATIILQGSSTNVDAVTGVIDNPALAIGSTAEKFANGAFNYRIAGVNYSKTAVAAGSTFTTTHEITASKWGAINIYINSAGTFVTKAVSALQAYDTAAAAHTAANTIELTSDVCYVGRILINNIAATWTANTDDLTDASDVTTATFLSETSSFQNLQTHAFTAGEITAQMATFNIDGIHSKYVRLYLSALTGTGSVDSYLDAPTL